MKTPLVAAIVGASFMLGAWVGHRGAMNSMAIHETYQSQPINVRCVGEGDPVVVDPRDGTPTWNLGPGQWIHFATAYNAEVEP